MAGTEKAMERLSGRMGTLDGLYKRGIVTGNLLWKQLKSLLSSKDARTVFSQLVEPDKKALKILNRIEDPEGWRELFTKDRDSREAIFYKNLVNIMDSGTDHQDRVLRMLQIACLPFYSGFLPLTEEKKKASSDLKPSRVSVLD
ncbi:MAG: hypothetical protein U9P42_06120 [Candidatus Fermentibacteria bacterium]|nr:hypothetical protein [Candidatus Fermentibacteria bacterium]